MMTQNPQKTAGDGEGAKRPRLVKPAARASLMGRLRNYFLTGIIVTAPIGITVYLAWGFIDFVDVLVTSLVPEAYLPETYLKVSIPGLGIVVVVMALTAIGFLTANFLGRSLIRFGEGLVDRMPVVRSIYGALKQILETVLQQSSTAFRQCVLVEYPRRDMWVVAFVSTDTRGEARRRLDHDLVSVFVPTTPNPTSGFLIFVPREDLVYLDMSVEEGMKLVISAGMVTPPDRNDPDYEPPKSERPGWRKRPAKAAPAVDLDPSPEKTVEDDSAGPEIADRGVALE